MSHAAKNYFELFGLSTSFGVDAKYLTARYRALCAAVRGEHCAAEAETARQQLSQAALDEAYRVLIDPLARAKYLLSLQQDLCGYCQEPECGNSGALLMEQMELRENLAAASNGSNSAMAVANMLTELVEQSASLAKELSGLLAEPSFENLSAAREIVYQLEFLARCQRDAEHRRPKRESR